LKPCAIGLNSHNDKLPRVTQLDSWQKNRHFHSFFKPLKAQLKP